MLPCLGQATTSFWRHTLYKGIDLGPAAWRASTQTLTRGPGFWVRLSVFDGSSQSCPCVCCICWQSCYIESSLPAPVVDCVTLKTGIYLHPPGACIWRWTLRFCFTIEMAPCFSGVALPEAEAWPWSLWLSSLTSQERLWGGNQGHLQEGYWLFASLMWLLGCLQLQLMKMNFGDPQHQPIWILKILGGILFIHFWFW